MASEKKPITIKKYANRRLYNTGTSTYVTLEDLAKMVKAGEDFLVFDAKSGEDITRAVLGQIIFEQEAKEGQSLMPITFLRQLIRLYGDSMQMVVPSFLEFSIGKFVNDQAKIRDDFMNAMGGKEVPGGQMFSAMEEQARKNMAMFNQAISMFAPFTAPAQPGEAEPSAATAASATKAAGAAPDFDEMRRQIFEMQRQIESLSRKG
jgi:polyhydroxyalkanoate synthesis repressor PhaR